MKQSVLAIFFIATFVVYPSQTNAISIPCSLTLKPIDKSLINSKGVTLIYKVQLNPPSFARTTISILDVHLLFV